MKNEVQEPIPQKINFWTSFCWFFVDFEVPLGDLWGSNFSRNGWLPTTFHFFFTILGLWGLLAAILDLLTPLGPILGPFLVDFWYFLTDFASFLYKFGLKKKGRASPPQRGGGKKKHRICHSAHLSPLSLLPSLCPLKKKVSWHETFLFDRKIESNNPNNPNNPNTPNIPIGL